MARPAASAPPARGPFRRLRDRARAGDPGWDRARTTLRAGVAGAVGVATCAPLVAVLDLPSELLPLSGALPMFAAATLPPSPRPRAHLATLWGVATASAGVATALGGHESAPLVAFVPVIAGAAWAGRWGTTGTWLGFVAFVAYLFSRLFDAAPDDLPTAVAATSAGTAGLWATVRWVLPDRPAALLRRLVRTTSAQLSLMVDAAEELAALGPGQGRQRRIRRRLVAVQEAALLVDTTLELGDARASVADPDQLRSDVLAAEALADHLAWSLLTLPLDTPPDRRRALAAELRRTREPMDVDVHRPVAPLVPRLVGEADDRAVEVLDRLAAAVERLVDAARPTGTDGSEVERDPPAPWPTPQPVARTVVQAVLACGVALVLGVALAPGQWYWAVVGAYVVVTTTGTRGEGLRKAVDRVVGTALGVVAGLGLASALTGVASIQLVVALGLILAAFWLLRVNYLWTMLLLTTTVALLYEVAGVLTPAVLGLRLAETALGAIVAGIVVFFVLPVRTRETVDGSVDALLAALDTVLERVEKGQPVGPAQVRHVDRAVSGLRATTEPLVTQAPTRIGGEVRAARLLATAVRVRVAALATATGADSLGEDGTTEAVAVVRAHLAALRSHLGGEHIGEVADLPGLASSASTVSAVLQAIDDRLAGYGTARGIVLREDPGALAGGTPSARD